MGQNVDVVTGTAMPRWCSESTSITWLNTLKLGFKSPTNGWTPSSFSDSWSVPTAATHLQQTATAQAFETARLVVWGNAYGDNCRYFSTQRYTQSNAQFKTWPYLLTRESEQTLVLENGNFLSFTATNQGLRKVSVGGPHGCHGVSSLCTEQLRSSYAKLCKSIFRHMQTFIIIFK